MKRSAIRSSPSQVRRPLAEWVLRGGIAAIALTLGTVSTIQTWAFAVRKSNAERAYALAPGDGRIAGELAEQIAVANSTPNRRAAWIARDALVDEPLATSALTALALTLQLRGNTGAARALFVHSDALSRRELGTRLWLIEDAVGRGDITGALRHYDIALRTAKGAPELLFPILAKAIADPPVAAALINTLTGRPSWSEAFIGHLAAVSTTPIISSVFLQRLARRGVPISEAAHISTVNALVNKGEVKAGWDYYAGFHRGIVIDRSRDPDFKVSIDTPSAFDWNPIINEAGISASIQSNHAGGVFDFSVPATVGGIVLRQSQLLPPGRYRIEGISAGIEQASGTRPYWQLVCNDGREAGRFELPASKLNEGRFTGEFSIGGNCPFQTLALVVRPSSDVGGVTGQIERVQLAPVGESH